MYVENLVKNLGYSVSITDPETLLNKWTKLRPNHPNVDKVPGMKKYLRTFVNYRDYFFHIMNHAQHFSYKGGAPIISLLPNKGLPIEEVYGLLTTIKARLPYRLMTISFDKYTFEGDIPMVAVLEELEEGLINIQLWGKDKEEAVIGDWDCNAFNMILSTHGDFSYWNGLVNYFEKNDAVDILPYAKKAKGYLFPMEFGRTLDESDFKYQLTRMEIELITAIIPYIYLLNVKNIPVKDFKSIHYFNKKRIKGSNLHIPSIIYKEININLSEKSSPGNKELISSFNESRKKAHLCRGHFKEYSKEKPLFGKYSGMVWCPPHKRGDSSEGNVIKSYSITDRNRRKRNRKKK